MSTRKNSYSTKQMDADIASLLRKVDVTAASIIAATLDKKFNKLAFDEVEVIPYSAKNYGSVVISLSDANDVTVDTMVQELLQDAIVTLEQDLISSLKEIIK